MDRPKWTTLSSKQAGLPYLPRVQTLDTDAGWDDNGDGESLCGWDQSCGTISSLSLLFRKFVSSTTGFGRSKDLQRDEAAAPDPACLSIHSISHTVLLKPFCRSKIPYKFVNLSFIVANMKHKLTYLCANRLLQNDLNNALCEITQCGHVAAWPFLTHSRPLSAESVLGT